MPQIRVDPEFQNKIPPLTEAEFKQLEDNILEAGRIYEPIAVWEQTGIIVDGHNRYKILLKHAAKGNKIKHEIRLMSFADKWEAFDWMYKNQLGRRNLTDEQKTYILGKLYEARKHVVAGNTTSARNADGTFQCAQSEHNGQKTIGRISDQIGKEQGVGKETVKRAGAFAKGIDAIRKVDSDLADRILTGQMDVPKVAVQYVGKTPDDQMETVVKAIREGNPITGHKDTREAKAIAKELVDDSITMEYTLDHLIEQMRCNADGFVNSLSNLLMDHKDISNANRAELTEAIDVIIINRINQIKERLNDGTQL